MGAKKISGYNTVTTMNTDDYVILNVATSVDASGIVRIKKTDLANGLADVMRTATAEQNGLMSARWEALTKRASMTDSMLIYEGPAATISVSISFLIGLAAYGGGPSALYNLSLYRAANTLVTPNVKLNLIGGIEATGSKKPRLKILNDETTGIFKIFIERIDYTIGVYASILNTFRQNIDKILLTKADNAEVAAAIYIDVS